MRNIRVFVRFSVMLASVVVFITAEMFVIFETLRRGVPVLLSGGASRNLAAQIINTILITAAALAVSMPLAIGFSLWIYRTKKTGLKKLSLRILSALSGVPSAVYGLFGYLLFGGIFSMRYSLLSGALTAALLILPPTVFMTASVLDSVEKDVFRGALALGAGEGKAAFSVLLPSASGGILNAAFLASSRVAAESAALILTSGIGETLPQNGIIAHFMRSGATITVGMYRSVLEGENDLAFSAGVVLLLFLLLADELSGRGKQCQRK